MADFLPVVGKLSAIETAQHRGTVTLLSPGYALTAAHCVGDRDAKILDPGPYVVSFPDQTIRVEVVRVDFRLDIALLKLQTERHADPLPLQALPRAAELPAGKLTWSGYGFPRAHAAGLGLHGSITLGNGNVEGAPAIQLLCEEGGFGGLEGVSGGPVCAADSLVGIIRFGPPGLYQKVLHATSLVDAAVLFPEVSELLHSAARYSRVQLYVVLTMLTPTQYEQLLFYLNAPKAMIASDKVPQAEQAMNLIRHYETQADELSPIIKLLERLHATLLKRVLQSS